MNDAETDDAAVIKAEVHSVDHERDHECQERFDAEPWFRQAGAGDILELALAGWRDCLETDEIAMFFKTRNARIGNLLTCVQRSKAIDPTIPLGFECNIDGNDAMHWLARNRPDLYAKLPEGKKNRMAILAKLRQHA